MRRRKSRICKEKKRLKGKMKESNGNLNYSEEYMVDLAARKKERRTLIGS